MILSDPNQTVNLCLESLNIILKILAILKGVWENLTFKQVEHGTGIFMLLGLKNCHESSIQNCIKLF